MAMKTPMQKLQEQKFLIISMLAIAFGILISNMISEDAASILFGNFAYIPIAGTVVILSILIAIKHRLIGSHGKAWVLFSLFIIFFFTAEIIWTVYELFLEIDPYPSEADFFWILGYPFYFAFLMFYLIPFRKAISKKMILSASLLSFALLLPSFYVSYDSEMELTDIENVIGLIYPLMDSIVLPPIIIGIVLFFTGKVNFLWSLMCLAILSTILADTGFLFTSLDDTYYSGHPIEILFLWTYILFAFGIYDHHKIFKIKQTRGQSILE